MTAQAHTQQSLREELERAIDALPPDALSIEALLEQFGANGLLLLSALLTLVFLIPVSIPGVSTVFGAAILMVGVSRVFNRPLWLPQTLLKRQLPTEKLRPPLQRGLIWVLRLEKISRQGRLPVLIDGRVMNLINDLALVLGAVLLMMPFGFIPFSNTVPGIALLFLAIGLIQRDGVAVLLGHLGNVATIIYFSILIGGGGLLFREMFQRFTE